MIDRKRSTRSRLAAGFLAIIGIFLVAVIYAIVTMLMVRNAMAEIEKHRLAESACLRMMGLTHERYTHQEHYIINYEENRPDHLTHFWHVNTKIKKALDQIQAQSLSPDEQATLDQIKKWDGEYVELFKSKIKPRVDSQPTVDLKDPVVQKNHRKSEDLTTDLTTAHHRLQEIFNKRIRVASKKVATVTTWAIAGTAGLLAVAAIFAAVISVRLSRSIVRPIAALVAGTDRVGGGDLSARIDLERSDEFGLLARSFNEMAERLKASQEMLLQSEKMASLGRLAAGVAHEINNPLAVIMGYTKVLMKKVGPDDPLYAELKTIDEESELCKRVVEDLLALSRPVQPSREPADLREVVDGSITRVQRGEKAGGIEWVRRFPDEALQVLCDEGKLQRAIGNVLLNGCEAMAWRGRMSVSLAREGDAAVLRVADGGPGVPLESAGKLFDPFYTTKDDGTGLGLSIAYGVLAAHDGSIALERNGPEGAVFAIRLPIAQ